MGVFISKIMLDLPGMRIRKALDTDKEKIFQVHVASIKQSCRNHYTKEQLDAWVSVLSPSVYDHALKKKEFFVAEDSEHSLLGLGMLDLDNAELSAIYIHPGAAGRGIGTRMLQKLELVAQQADIKKLTVYSTINANGFYQQFGYQEQGPAQHNLPNGFKLECIHMTKVLT